ncbi:MAG: hypothetical protein A2W98_05745 [Bacteroidetes bacterium GWF2_33_38]|nr:MAG: hypothetical protein A2W98_05745 [Bacteroidetes bacterium GWF2_33_38]HBX51664.1 hypothetical protein [Bacteroidales bacterium]
MKLFQKILTLFSSNREKKEIPYELRPVIDDPLYSVEDVLKMARLWYELSTYKMTIQELNKKEKIYKTKPFDKFYISKKKFCSKDIELFKN